MIFASWCDVRLSRACGGGGGVGGGGGAGGGCRCAVVGRLKLTFLEKVHCRDTELCQDLSTVLATTFVYRDTQRSHLWSSI